MEKKTFANPSHNFNKILDVFCLTYSDNCTIANFTPLRCVLCQHDYTIAHTKLEYNHRNMPFQNVNSQIRNQHMFFNVSCL